MNLFFLLLICFLFSGCTENKNSSLIEPANRVIEKTVTIPPPQLVMKYQLESGVNPGLEKAYQYYMKTGIAKTVETDQFIQFPYDSGSQPIVSANVFDLSVISLEPGEQVSSVSCGDPTRWSYSLAYSGTEQSRQAHIMVKPAKANISTDFFITTDRRAYNLKLFSNDNGKYIREVRFWYPQIIQNNWNSYNHEKQQQRQQNPVIAEFNQVNLDHLNFSYQLQSKQPWPTWGPIRAFDDGTHTYIQFSNQISSMDLPALFVKTADNHEIVNYRFKNPYLVIDKIFKTAVLLSGVGHAQQQVIIINKNIGS